MFWKAFNEKSNFNFILLRTHLPPHCPRLPFLAGYSFSRYSSRLSPIHSWLRHRCFASLCCMLGPPPSVKLRSAHVCALPFRRRP